MGGQGPPRQVSGEYPVFTPQARDQSLSPRGPMPSMTPTESPKPTPSKRRTSWLKNLGSHHKDAGGRTPLRGKRDSQEGKSAPRRAFSHDVTSLLHLRRPSTDNQQQQQFRPPFGHNVSGSFHASPQNSFSPQYASPQNSFGPSDQRPQYGSPAGSYGRQRSGSLPLPPGVTVDAREVSSVASNTPPSLAQTMAPQIQLDLPPPTLMKDEHLLSGSPTHSGSPQPSGISSQRNSGSPHPSQNTSRHPSGVPSVAQSMTSEQRLENEETRDNFDVDKPLPNLDAVQDDHEHTGVKPPVPIGKYQPSWDPFNATPIAEEKEGSEYSFGAGKISPPKLSPPNLDTVNEGEGKIGSTQSSNPVLAGAAGIALAAGATAMGLAIAANVSEVKEHKEEQPQREIRETIVETRELDEDDIYDASPPPKSARRSLSVSRDQPKPAPQVPLGVAAGTVTTVVAIKDQVQALRSDDNTPQSTKDEEWELVEHKDAPLAATPKDEPSYFPPTAPPAQKKEYAPTPPFNARLGIDGHSRNQSRGHSRGISEVSAVSAMSIGTMSPGEVVDASQVTVEQTSPSSVKLRDSLQSVVSKQSQEQEEQDLEELAPPKPAFMAARGSEKGQRTPTMESVPGWFPETPGVSEAPSSIRAASVKEDDLTPRQEQRIISLLSPAQQLLGGHTEQQQGFGKPTHGVQPMFAQPMASPTFSIEDDRRRLSKAEMIPEAVQRAQDDVSDISDEEDESPYHETLGIIRGLGVEAQRTGRNVGPQSGMVQSREPMTAQREHATRAKLEQTLSGTATRLGQPQSTPAISEADAVRVSNVAGIGQPAHVGKREFSPDDDEDYDQEFYLPDWGKAEMNQRRKAWKEEHPGEMVPYHVLHPRYSKGIVVPEELDTRQREPEADRVRASNAAAIQQSGKGKGVGKYEFTPSDDKDESAPFEPAQMETEKLQALKERDQKIKDELTRQEALLGQVYNKGSAISEEPVSRQRDEVERVRALNAEAIRQFGQGPTIAEELRRRKAEGNWLQQGMTQSREPEPLQRAFLETEKMKLESSAQPDIESRWPGMTQTREPVDRRPVQEEAEKMRTANQQVLETEANRKTRTDPEALKQQISEAEMVGNYIRAEALKSSLMNVWANKTKGVRQSRELEDKRPVHGEAEKMRIANAQVVEQQQGETQAPYFAAMGTVPRPQHQAQSMGPGATMSREPQFRQREPERAKQPAVYGGAVRSMEPEVRQKGSEAETARAANAKVVRSPYEGDTMGEELQWRNQGSLAQHGMTISREPEPRQADFQGSEERMRLHNEQTTLNTRVDEGAERMRNSNARKLWTQQDQMEFDTLYGAQSTSEQATFEQPTRSLVPPELVQAAATNQAMERSLTPVELQTPNTLTTEDVSSLSDEDHGLPAMGPPWGIYASRQPENRQREPIPRKDSVELARTRSLPRVRRAAHGDDEEEDHSRPHVVHVSTEEEKKKKAASDAWLAGVKMKEDKMRRQEAERAAQIARNAPAGSREGVTLGATQSREPDSKQREPEAKRKSWAQEVMRHISLVGDKVSAQTPNVDQNGPQLHPQEAGPQLAAQRQQQEQLNRGIGVPLGLQQMARDSSPIRKDLEPVRRDLDDSPPPKSPARTSRLLAPLELRRPIAATEQRSLSPSELRYEDLSPLGPGHVGGGMAESREDYTHEPRNITAPQQQQSRLPPAELQRPVDKTQPRSIVPIELQQAAQQQHTRSGSSSPPFSSLSVPKHRTSPSKDLIVEDQRNPESPSTSTASGSGFAIPPIRRTSTFRFGVVTKAKPAKDRFSIEDDDGEEDQGPHVVSPMSTTSIDQAALPLPAAPKLHREEAVANSPDLRQRAGSIGIAPSGPAQPQEPTQSLEQRQDTFVPVSSSLRRTSNVPRRASQEAGEARENRFSFQREGSQPVQEVLSRPPITHQSSSDYGQAWTGQSTPTPLKGERPNYMAESAPRVVPAAATAAAVGAGSMLGHQSQQQQMPPQPQPQPYQNISQARGGPVPTQQRQFSYETQQQQQQRGHPIQPVGQFPGQDRRQSSAPLGPQRPSMDAQHQRNLSMDSQRMMQHRRGPSLGGVGTTPAQPPKIVPRYNETVARPLSYTRSGARDGPPGIPPSSAERYPELFQNSQPADSPTSPTRDGDGRQGKEREGDIPGDYAVVGKGHLPRQQATEYALPGVGPPADDPRNGNGGGRSSRRNSGFLKEIGGRLSRDSSRHRERRSSVDRRADERQRASMVEPNKDNLVISKVEDRRSALESRDSDDDMSIAVDEKTASYKKDKPRRRSLLDVFSQKPGGERSEQQQQIQQPQPQPQQPMYGRPPSQVESMITHRANSHGDLLTSPPSSTGPHSQPQQLLQGQNGAKEEKSKKKWSFFGKKKEKDKQLEEKRENAGVILATAGPAAAANQSYNVGVVQRPGQPPVGQQTFVPQQQQQIGLQQFDPRDPRYHQQQQPRQQLTGGPQRQPSDPRMDPMFQHKQQFQQQPQQFQQMQSLPAQQQQQSQPMPQRVSVPVPQPIRHASTALRTQEPVRSTQTPTSTSGSLPPVEQIPGAFPREETPRVPQAQTPVIAPQPGRGPVPSEFTPRTGTPASSVQQLPPALAQERVLTPKSPLGAVPIQPPPMQQQQQRLPPPQMQRQNQTAYQASQPQSQIGGPPYSPQQSQPPRGQHQAYAQQLAQGPLSLKKTNSNADRHVLQKRPSSVASSQKGKEVKEKKKSFLGGLLGKRGAEKEKKVGLVAALGAAGVAAQQQQQHQHQGQQQMSGAMPSQGQQFGHGNPRVQKWQQQQQQQMLQDGPQRQLQGAPQPQPQQRYESPPIPGPYAHVRSEGQLGPVNQGPMILTPHQQMALHQGQQPVFADQRSYDEYVRQHQALQARQQGLYANLPPPPAQGYNAPRQEQVPTQFRRASQEYVRDLNARSSQEYARRDSIGARRDSNPMAGGQQLNPTYTQGLAAQRPPSQRQEPIPVAIPAWKRATRDTPNTTTPPPANASPPPLLGPQGDFPHLTAYNPNAKKTPDSPQPQAKGSRPFLGLNDDRRMTNLSTEDLLARSPARAQFGQQAPYQLSLPVGDNDDDDDDDDDIIPERRSPHKSAVPVTATGVAATALAGAAIAGRRESRERSPLSQQFPPHQQQQASNVPVPETAFSPIADRGDGFKGGETPPPLIPKWSSPPTPTGGVRPPQLGHPQHQVGVGLLHTDGQVYQPGQLLTPNNNAGVGRSNTVMSDVSNMTVDSPHQTPSPRQSAGFAPATSLGYNDPPQHQHKKSIFATSPVIGDRLSQVQSNSSGVSVSPRSTPNDTPVVQQAQSVVTHQRPAVSQGRTEPVVQRIRIPSDIRSPPLQQQQAPVQQTIQEQPREQIEMPMPPPMPTTRAPSPPVTHQQAPANATGGFIIQDDRAPADRPIVLTQHPDHSGLIYDNSREGLIVVEDANVRRVNQGQATAEEDGGPVMSATSFPGDEWRPFGWDEGGYD